MTTKNKLLTTLILSSSAVTGIALINKYIKVTATSKNVIDKSNTKIFHWRFGDINYVKCGEGSPLLLVHDLTSASSNYEWNQIISALANEYTVYAIDLLGCGCSEKPYLTYTNYLYVQLISDFIKSEISHRTDIIASGSSSSFVIMTCSTNSELFNRIILINPDSLEICSQMPGKYSKYYKRFLDMPVIGTLLYHIASSKKALKEDFEKYCFYNPDTLKKSILDTYYESSHIGFSPKSVYASVRCNYTKCNITNALKKIDNSIYLIGGEYMEHCKSTFQEYVSQNPSIEYTIIPETKYLPHIEKPMEFLTQVKTFFSNL